MASQLFCIRIGSTQKIDISAHCHTIPAGTQKSHPGSNIRQMEHNATVWHPVDISMLRFKRHFAGGPSLLNIGKKDSKFFKNISLTNLNRFFTGFGISLITHFAAPSIS